MLFLCIFFNGIWITDTVLKKPRKEEPTITQGIFNHFIQRTSGHVQMKLSFDVYY